MSDFDDEIIQDFLIECREHLDTLDSGLVLIEQEPSDRQTLSSIFRSIHTIKGGAGMLAFNKLEKLTHSAENLLSLLRDGKLTLSSEMITCLLHTLDTVRHMLDLISQTGNDGSDDYASLIEKLNKLQSGESISTDETEAAAAEPAVETHAEEAAEAVAETEPTAEPEVIIAKPEAPEALPPAINDDGADPKLNSMADATVRINVELLDKLMNLVGELVLSRNQILQFISTLSDSNFMAVSQRLNLITSELQEGVMKTRMQPIGNVWCKFSRIVRDLAQSCNKKVNLKMIGSDTELDKTLIEAIKDPMTHIVRNSVDHGIESVEQRRAKGKPDEGTLTLKAYHEGGHVNIEVHDDGGGISAEKVKAKALERGLITHEQAARLCERDALNLIFLPGLSTAEKITNVSGRGVGMDVVRTNIERINGTIDIQSELGVSTTLKIKIPLTLAIIPALIITCHSHRYAIPQISLVELVHLEAEDIKKNIKYIKETPLYCLRGKLLPLIYLSKELEFKDDKSQHQPGINVVILQAGDNQFGLVVDQINDTQEIVVKPLSKLLKSQQAFSGATIMGDGTISLILDVTGIARKAGLLSATLQEDGKLSSSDANIDGDHEKQTLLLLKAGIHKLMAVPLIKVDRIEEFLNSSVEHSGDMDVVQYRNSIMPLLYLSDVINNTHNNDEDKDKIQVIVYSSGKSNFGLVVDQVCDIVEGHYKFNANIKRRGILGTSVIEDKVTEIIDLDGIVKEMLPTFVH